MSSLNVQGQCMQDKKTDKVGSDKCELKKIRVRQIRKKKNQTQILISVSRGTTIFKA